MQRGTANGHERGTRIDAKEPSEGRCIPRVSPHGCRRRELLIGIALPRPFSAIRIAILEKLTVIPVNKRIANVAVWRLFRDSSRSSEAADFTPLNRRKILSILANRPSCSGGRRVSFFHAPGCTLRRLPFSNQKRRERGADTFVLVLVIVLEPSFDILSQITRCSPGRASSLEKRSQAAICHLPFVILNASLLRAIDHRRHVVFSHIRDLRPSSASPGAISFAVSLAIPIAGDSRPDANCSSQSAFRSGSSVWRAASDRGKRL
jgi:hypothetical protein